MNLKIKHSPNSGTFLSQKTQQHSHCCNEHDHITTARGLSRIAILISVERGDGVRPPAIRDSSGYSPKVDQRRDVVPAAYKVSGRRANK